MKLIYLIDEDFINYKKASMVLGMPFCSCKCDIDNGTTVCQNDVLKNSTVYDFDIDELIKRYLSNKITNAIVFQGREPFDSTFDLISFVDTFRNKYNCQDDLVIYTGYTEQECNGHYNKEYNNVNFEKVHLCYEQLKKYENIIIKFGRYIPGDEPHYDSILGVELASDNQYAKKVFDN